ncbi:DoxX family protein [Streptomyces sp. NPDC051018]|uniref:DoxX family protein n=1 Tax=Streptomyces sp. NPDC051018 TaxID=3365639 RepID=UPI00378B743E
MPVVGGALGRYRRHSTTVLRVSVGLVFLGFGVMKFVPGASPAEDVATRTMDVLAFGLVPPEATRPLLALLETVIGLGLVSGVLLRVTLAAFFIHMVGVFSALLVLPAEMWNEETGTPTLEGQYIIKNVVLIAACLAVAAEEVLPGPGGPGREPPYQEGTPYGEGVYRQTETAFPADPRGPDGGGRGQTAGRPESRAAPW